MTPIGGELVRHERLPAGVGQAVVPLGGSARHERPEAVEVAGVVEPLQPLLGGALAVPQPSKVSWLAER